MSFQVDDFVTPVRDLQFPGHADLLSGQVCVVVAIGEDIQVAAVGRPNTYMVEKHLLKPYVSKKQREFVNSVGRLLFGTRLANGLSELVDPSDLNTVISVFETLRGRIAEALDQRWAVEQELEVLKEQRDAVRAFLGTKD